MEIVDALNILRDHNVVVPKPPRLPTEEEVIEAERELGVAFSHEYKTYQLIGSDIVHGTREPGLLLPGLSPYLCLRAIANNGWELGTPKDFLPFCSDNGNYFTISSDGYIGYMDHDDHSHGVIYDRFSDWVIEEWLDDE